MARLHHIKNKGRDFASLLFFGCHVMTALDF